MSEQDVATVRSTYDNFNQGNIPGVLEIYDEQIEWTEPGGGNAPSGTFKGRDEVAAKVFGPVPENFDEFSVEIDDVEDQGETVVVKGRYKGKNKNGAELDAPFEHINELKDGKLVRFESKVDAEAWAAGWS
ncbi:MAG: nuclear transport factor 2 family protein [Solirubrobacterales bacterium]